MRADRLVAAPADDVAAGVQRFSTQDKHRLLVPAAASIELNQSLAILIPSQGCRYEPDIHETSVYFGKGDELVAETFLITGPDPRVWMSGRYAPLSTGRLSR